MFSSRETANFLCCVYCECEIILPLIYYFWMSFDATISVEAYHNCIEVHFIRKADEPCAKTHGRLLFCIELL